MALAPTSLIGRLQRFGLVGVIGFVTDAALLTGLVRAGLDPFSARLVSILVAATVTWRLNRALTFGASETSQASEGLRYGGVVFVASAVNYLVYAGLMLAMPALIPAIALAIASIVAMALSYLGYSHFAFGRKTSR